MELALTGECGGPTAVDMSRVTMSDEVARPATGSREVEDVATITKAQEADDPPTTTRTQGAEEPITATRAQEAEGPVTTTRTQEAENPPTTTSPPPTTASPEEFTRIVLAEYACRLSDGRAVSYTHLTLPTTPYV